MKQNFLLRMPNYYFDYINGPFSIDGLSTGQFLLKPIPEINKYRLITQSKRHIFPVLWTYGGLITSSGGETSGFPINLIGYSEGVSSFIRVPTKFWGKSNTLIDAPNTVMVTSINNNGLEFKAMLDSISEQLDTKGIFVIYNLMNLDLMHIFPWENLNFSEGYTIADPLIILDGEIISVKNQLIEMPIINPTTFLGGNVLIIDNHSNNIDAAVLRYAMVTQDAQTYSPVDLTTIRIDYTYSMKFTLFEIDKMAYIAAYQKFKKLKCIYNYFDPILLTDEELVQIEINAENERKPVIEGGLGKEWTAYNAIRHKNAYESFANSAFTELFNQLSGFGVVFNKLNKQNTLENGTLNLVLIKQQIMEFFNL